MRIRSGTAVSDATSHTALMVTVVAVAASAQPMAACAMAVHMTVLAIAMATLPHWEDDSTY